MTPVRVFAALVTLSWLAAFASYERRAEAAEEKPAVKEAAADVGTVRQQSLKGFTYFYKTTHTNMAGLGAAVQKIIPELHQAVADAKVSVRGPIVFIYHGVEADHTKEFALEIGMPVDPGTKPAGDFQVRDVPEYKCARVLYTGALHGISAAFEKLMPGIEALKSEPTDEAREMYLYFEGPDSPNNVVHVSIGLK